MVSIVVDNADFHNTTIQYTIVISACICIADIVCQEMNTYHIYLIHKYCHLLIILPYHKLRWNLVIKILKAKQLLIIYRHNLKSLGIYIATAS